jgi:hypothetical protein
MYSKIVSWIVTKAKSGEGGLLVVGVPLCLVIIMQFCD